MYCSMILFSVDPLKKFILLAIFLLWDYLQTQFALVLMNTKKFSEEFY